LPGGDIGQLFNVVGMRPGDQATANLSINNGGTVDLTWALTIDATTSSLLNTASSPVANDLQLDILRCGATFTLCGQTVYTGRAIVSNAPMGGPDTVGTSGGRGLRPQTRDYLRMRVSFPITAGNTFRNEHSILRFVWTSTQAL
jgi:hypothetical protein